MGNCEQSVRQQKQAIRREALARREAFPEKDAASKAIWTRFLALPQYHAAGTVLCYVHFGSEVRTQEFLPRLLADSKCLVVPYCQQDELGLFRLESIDELAPGTWGILEPRAELRSAPGKPVEPCQIDLVIVPGVAFDPRGNRLGYGKGYYDRLLRRLRPGVAKVGMAFECQLFEQLPSTENDVPVDLVITQCGRYPAAAAQPKNHAADRQ